MKKGALISDCQKYRYTLSRIWDEEKPMCMFLMLNPSTADAELDDPTIRRCIQFAKDWGYGGIHVGNRFAYRATDPKELLKRENIAFSISLNHYWLKKMEEKSDIVVLAWGNKSILKRIEKEYNVLSNLPTGANKLDESKFRVLELANDGKTPKHPLYLKSTLKPLPLTPDNKYTFLCYASLFGKIYQPSSSGIELNWMTVDEYRNFEETLIESRTGKTVNQIIKEVKSLKP